MRALDLYGLSRDAVDLQSDGDAGRRSRPIPTGVNAWLKVVQEQALGRGAPEFFLFDARDRSPGFRRIPSRS